MSAHLHIPQADPGRGPRCQPAQLPSCTLQHRPNRFNRHLKAQTGHCFFQARESGVRPSSVCLSCEP